MPKVSLAKLDLAVIQKEINRRLKKYNKLCSQRAKLDEKIAEFEKLLPLTGKAVAKRGRKPGRKGRGPGRPKLSRAKRGRRPRNASSLPEVLFNCMKGKGKVSISDAAKMAVEAGYKTKSKNFNLVIGMAFKADKRFKKVARGIYTVK